MAKPKHFETEKDFTVFLLQCALYDRQAFLDAYTCTTRTPENEKIVAETRAEIKAIEQRQARYERG